MCNSLAEFIRGPSNRLSVHSLIFKNMHVSNLTLESWQGPRLANVSKHYLTIAPNVIECNRPDSRRRLLLTVATIMIGINSESWKSFRMGQEF